MLVTELLSLFERSEDRQAVSLLLNWFRQLRAHGQVQPEDYNQLEQTYQSIEEVRSMLVTAITREKEELLQQGIEQGRAEGIAQEKQKTARAMHAKGFDLDTIADITGLTVAELRAILHDEGETE